MSSPDFPTEKAALSLDALRCEYRTDPLGIDTPTPRLSWVLCSDIRGERQHSYHILVATSPELLSRDVGDLWDSGRVASDCQNQIEYAGVPLASRMHCHWKVRGWNRREAASEWSPPARWSMGLLNANEWRAKWIGLSEPLAPKPLPSDALEPQAEEGPRLLATPRYLRKDFRLEAGVRRATLYATALGLHEPRLNGKKVGDHLLAPEWTNYHKRIQYQTYDVTHQLQPGSNVIGAILGNGWYSGLLQKWPCNVRIYGDEPLLLAQLEIEFDDGKRQVIVSDSSWQGTLNGPLRFAGIYEGEFYDARRDMPGWDVAGFAAAEWRSVVEVNKPVAGKLVWQRGEAIRATREAMPVTLTEPQPGTWVFCFDQNLVGWCRFRGRGDHGEQIELQYGEMLNPDGSVYTGNLRVVCRKHQSQLDRYVFRGDREEIFEPRFTYHGFQYVEVRGLRQAPTLESLTGIVFHTDCPETGTFRCSEPLLDRLAENILWSQRGNFMGVPTDCPQRDERCGYTGDAQFFIRTATYNMDIAAFFSKWLVDLCEDSQLPGGWFADHAPHYAEAGAGPNIGWSDAGIICPYEIYRTYGDTRVIREHYAAMKRKLAWLDQQCPENLFRGRAGNGDWLNLGGGASDEVLGTAYAAFDFKLMSEMASAIGEEADALQFHTRARALAEAFASVFLDENGAIRNCSQTGYALAFTMDLAPEHLRSKMGERFVEELQRFAWHPATGFIGTPRLLPGLHHAGHDDAAYRLLLLKTCPSWLYPVTVHATTVWEHWDSFDGRTPKGGMNSLNHYSLGSVGEYLYAHLGGIQPEKPGYRQIRIEPVIREGITWARTTYKSIRGPITTAWKSDGDHLALEVDIPCNASALVYLPAPDADCVKESGTPAALAREVSYLRKEGKSVVFQIGSGRYHFTVNTPK